LFFTGFILWLQIQDFIRMVLGRMK
jgi:hypothetical protein